MQISHHILLCAVLVAGVEFRTAPNPRPLAPKTRYIPDVSMMHQDGGNTGSTDYPGPTQKNVSVTKIATYLAPLLFDWDGGITAGGVIASPNLTYTLNAIDTVPLAIISSWDAPAG